ncbi:MAG: diguanylate cyclase domain-containing protein [Solirubrobacterales bacterium]
MSDAPPASAERLRRAARSAHDLSDALWVSLHEELSSASGERAAELTQRLADVASALALLACAPASAPALSEAPLEPPEPTLPDAGIEIRDTREDERPTQPSAWTGSIGRRLERYHEDRLPFAVLLIEIVDIERLARAESPQELARLTTQTERAIGGELRPADVLTHEALGRYWLVTPETDAPGARHLAERLARTVRLAAQHRGVPLEIAIGIAICPEDGQDASALAAHADVGVYAARASGRSVAPVDDPAA